MMINPTQNQAKEWEDNLSHFIEPKEGTLQAIIIAEEINAVKVPRVSQKIY